MKIYVSKLKVGDVVEIKHRIHGHGFTIRDKVKISEVPIYDDKNWHYRGYTVPDMIWSFCNEEISDNPELCLKLMKVIENTKH